MKRWMMVATVMVVLGWDAANAQEAPPGQAGPVQSRREAKGKKAVPARGGEADQDKPAFSLAEPTPKGNPMLTLSQARKPKPPMGEAAAGNPAPATQPTKVEPKNTAMMGMGFNSNHGFTIHAEVRREDVHRTCTMILPNLFFRIPARGPESDKKDISTPIDPNQARLPIHFVPMSRFISSAEDKIDLTGSQYLGLVEVERGR